jgi:hypothetical protein
MVCYYGYFTVYPYTVDSVVPTSSSRFPAPILPTVIQWDDMLSTAFSLAIVGYVINLAMGRTLAAGMNRGQACLRLFFFK